MSRKGIWDRQQKGEDLASPFAFPSGRPGFEIPWTTLMIHVDPIIRTASRIEKLERETSLELATSTLARLRSTN